MKKPSSKYLLALQTLVLNSFKNEKVKIVLFGSRARRDYGISSDVDIGILPYKKIDETNIALLREKIESSNIPFKVDLVDFSNMPASFKKEALKKAIVWKDWR